jgi:transaldolase
MNIEAALRERILKERKAEETLSAEGVWDRIKKGDDTAARGSLLFFTASAQAASVPDDILRRIDKELSSASPESKKGFLRFLTYLALDFSSFVPEWVLLKSLKAADVEKLAASSLHALDEASGREPAAAADLLAELRKESSARFKAEGLTDEGEIAGLCEALAGGSLRNYVETIAREVKKSNLRTAAKAHADGRLATEIGNDYAAFLNYVIRLGGSFVTTNPVLIKLAWDIDPPYWNRRVDEVITSRLTKPEIKKALSGGEAALTAAIEDINNFVTVEVVEGNCRMLRPIFLITEGTQGYVSLQVNPKAHNDGDKMVEAATLIYGELERRLGGVPNVVIKVPSTAAGLYAAEKLTAKGIGVTVTLTFSLFQALPFARVLDAGHALISYIAIMNGRLAFPVRDELKKNAVPRGVEAARWAGIEVARKAALRMYAPPAQGGLGVDSSKVKIMIASLRIYEDWIPDISELWGIPLITIFPNVRRAYDAGERPLEPDTVNKKTLREDLEVLVKSELFRQAWWTPEDGDYGKPDRVLSLEKADAEAVAAFTPVHETLTQFIGMYKEMSEMVRGRMAALAE